MKQQIIKSVYLKAEGEAPKEAVRRNKRLKQLAKRYKCSESGVFRRFLDESCD